MLQNSLGTNEDLLSQSSVDPTNAQGNNESLERDVENNSLDPPKFFFGTLQDFSDIISESQNSLSCAKNLRSTSPHPKSRLQHQDPPQEEAPCSAQSHLRDNEELPSQNSVETNYVQDSLEGLRDATKNSSGPPKCYFGVLEDVSDIILGLPVSAFLAEDLFPPSPHAELSLLSRNSPREDATYNAENSLSDDEELSLLSSVETNDPQGNAESLKGLKDTKNSSLGSPQFHFGAVQNMSDSVTEVQDSSSPEIGVLSTSRHSKSSLSSLDSLQEDTSDGAESCFGGREELLFQSSVGSNITHNVGKLAELGILIENSVPSNLFQDSWSSKLCTLPDRHRTAIENLTSQIGYQINCFSPKFRTTSQSSMSLFCKVCQKYLSAKGAVNHVSSQEHLGNLSQWCGKTGQISVDAPIDTENWECFGLTDVYKNVGSPEPYFVPSSTAQTKLQENSFRVVTELLSSKDKQRLKHVQHKLQDDINYFKPTYEDEQGRLFLICKICKESILLQNVMSHVSSNAHLKKLKKYPSAGQNSGFFSDANEKIFKDLMYKFKDFAFYFEPFENVSDQLHFICKVCAMVLLPKDVRAHSSTHCNGTEKNSTNLNSNAKSLSNSDEKIIKNLTNKLGDYMKYFKPSFDNGSDELRFTCNVCCIPIHPKNVRSHISATSHLNNVRKSLSDVKLEALSTRNEKLVKKLLQQFNCQLYVFQLKCDKRLDKLYFVCQVCNTVMIPEDVKSHISSEKHLTNSLTNPFSLLFESLNESNKEIVREVAAAIKDIGVFNLVYRIGTDELRFSCKYCPQIVTPLAVKGHVKNCSNLLKAVSERGSDISDMTGVPNLKRQILEYDGRNSANFPPRATSNSENAPSSSTATLRQNLTVVSFDSLSNTDKELVKKVIKDSNTSITYFDFLYSVDKNKLYLKCRFCDIKFNPEKVSSHVKNLHHLRNWRLNSSFKNFLVLECSVRKILRRLFYETKEKLKDFVLLHCVDDKKLEFKCKFCKVRVFSDSVFSHLQAEEHQKLTGGEGDKPPSTTDVSKAFVQHTKNNLDHESPIHKTVTHRNPVCAVKDVSSLSVCESVLNWNLESVAGSIEGVIREQNTKTLTSDLNHQIRSNSELCFDCQDCNNYFFKTEENDVNREVVKKIFITCHEKSTRVLSNSDEEILNMLQDNLGEKLNNFYFTVNSLEELRFKCKVCSLILSPETVEKHVNDEKHLQHSQLSDAFLVFDNLSDGSKNLIRKLYDEMGSEINDYDLAVSFNFVCKICGVNVSPETVANHNSSEEHLKHGVSYCYGNLAGPGNVSRNGSGHNSDFLNNEKKTQDIFGCGDFSCLPQNICDQKFDCSDNRNEAVRRKVVEKTSHTFGEEDHVGEVGISKTSVTAFIVEQILKFLDSDESSECYQCILCKKKLSSSSISWIEHFKSTYHILKSSKPNIFLNPVSAISVNKTANCSKNVCEEVSRMAPSRLKSLKRSALRSVEHKLQDDAKYYELSHESGEVRFICKLCGECVSDAIRHHSDVHKNNSERTSSDVNLEAAQNEVDDGRSNFDPLLSSVTNGSSSVDEKVVESKETQADSIANCSENVCEEVSRKGRKGKPSSVRRMVKYSLQDDAKYYEPSYKSGKFGFICKLCGESVSDAIRHHSDAHKNISEQTLSDVNLEAAQNKVDGLRLNFNPLLSSVTNGSSSVDEKVVESKEIQADSIANCSENVCEEVSCKRPKSRPCKVRRMVKYVLQDDAKYYEPSYKSGKFRFICKLCGESVSDAIRHHSDAHKNNSEQTSSDENLEAAQNKVDGPRLNFDPLSSSVTNGSSSVDEKVVESKETQADSIVAVNGLPDTSPEYYRTKMQSNLSTGCNGKIAEAVVTDKRNEFSASRSGSYDVVSSGIAQNNGHVTATSHQTASIPEFMCIIPNPHNQEYAIYLNNSKNEFKDFNLAAEAESEMSGINSVSCTVCRLDVITDDIANHVNSKEHAINLELSVNVCFKTLCDYYEEVVGMFTGNVNHGNNFEIFYELPLNELRFYCKLCNIMLNAESLENHVNHSHQNDVTEEFKVSGTTRMHKVIQQDLETGGENQLSKLFFCKPCNHQVNMKDIADHVETREHLKSLEIIGNYLDVDSFIAYKERVVATLSCEPWKNPNDFEFFRNIGSSKLLLYCKPCKALLQPEFLNHHIRHTNHRHNSVVRCCSVLFPEGSPRPEIVTHHIDSRIEQSGVSDDDLSANTSTSICSLM